MTDANEPAWSEETFGSKQEWHTFLITRSHEILVELRSSGGVDFSSVDWAVVPLDRVLAAARRAPATRREYLPLFDEWEELNAAILLVERELDVLGTPPWFDEGDV